MDNIYWLTGNSGVGKTTLSKMFQKENLCIVLDGDEIRESISLGTGFSKKEREEHNLRVARLAGMLVKQNFTIIIAVIAPFESTRKKIAEIIPDVKWIYLKRDMEERENYPYEEPVSFDLIINTTNEKEEDSYIKLKKYIKI